MSLFLSPGGSLSRALEARLSNGHSHRNLNQERRSTKGSRAAWDGWSFLGCCSSQRPSFLKDPFTCLRKKLLLVYCIRDGMEGLDNLTTETVQSRPVTYRRPSRRTPSSPTHYPTQNRSSSRLLGWGSRLASICDARSNGKIRIAIMISQSGAETKIRLISNRKAAG